MAVGVLLFVSTFFGPLLAAIVGLEARGAAAAPRDAAAPAAAAVVAAQLWSLAMYMLNVLVQRHHLFIWSVFAPRLLYDLGFLAVTAVAWLLLR